MEYLKFEEQVNALLKKMSLREKVGQLNQQVGPCNEEDMKRLKDAVRKGEIGSIIMAHSATAGNDPQQSINMKMYEELQRVAVEESPNRIPLIYGRDVIHGHHTVYPIPLAMSASFDSGLIQQCYRCVAKEATADGIHWTFTPMLDLCRDPRWGRIIEGPGEDPLVGSKLSEAVVKGLQGEDISKEDSLVACAKHFIGYGASEGGRDYHRTEISDYSLYNYYLPAFRSAVNAGVATVMSSFNDINGQPVTSGYHYLTEILREQLGFQGFVISDWDAVHQLIKQGVCETEAESVALAIEAGVDMDMADGHYINHLEELVHSGAVPMDVVDQAVKRVLRIKFTAGLFEHPYSNKETLDKKEHLKIARQMAVKSMVLLKNDNQILPLKKSQKIALVGPFVDERRALLGSWTLDGCAEETPTLLETMIDKIGKDRIFLNKDLNGLYDNTVETAAQADVIVLALGESEKVTGEARSLSDITLSKDQIELIKTAKFTGKKVIGVMFCGRPIAMEGIAEYLDAILYAWHSGSATANAVCDILFGDAVPSAKTPITFPRRTGHIPLYYNVTSSGRYVNGYYNENPQYSYNDSLSSPYYPFGYGLSYTTFLYTDLQCKNKTLSIEEIKKGKKYTVAVTIRNTGDYDGEEIVQLYIHDKVASVMRPLRELKAYEKVFLAQNEEKQVVFELGKDELGFYNSQGEYIIEKGEFEIYVGSNCLTENKCSIFII